MKGERRRLIANCAEATYLLTVPVPCQPRGTPQPLALNALDTVDTVLEIKK